MDNELVIRYADEDDINTIGFLAHEIWPSAYGAILPPGQIEYMLRLFYAPASLKDQMARQKHQFLLAEVDDSALGFASYSHLGDNIYKLHKLYVMPATQGKGVGKALLDFITSEIKPLGAISLRLGVNRFNRALQFYERVGFSKLKEEKTDIGNGFVMDDYILELTFLT
jgi:diamine N-acetyltransferase